MYFSRKCPRFMLTFLMDEYAKLELYFRKGTFFVADFIRPGREGGIFCLRLSYEIDCTVVM